MRVLIVGAGGYIGTYLSRALTPVYPDLMLLDRTSGPADLVRTFPQRRNFLNYDYRDISYDLYDVVLWFAGASSVIEAGWHPMDTLDQNALGILKMRLAMKPDAYLIYASSASVYSGWPGPSREADPIHPSTNCYDRSKFLIDYLNEGGWLPNSLGLRLGTVCGWSDPIRADTVFNKMNLDALELGKVVVSGRDAHRSLIFLDDLRRIVQRCIEQRPTGLLNTASYSCTIGYIANIVGAFHRVPVEDLGGHPTYVHHMDTLKLEGLYNPTREPTLTNRCEAFQVNWDEAQGHYTVSWPAGLEPPRTCPVPKGAST